LPIAFIFVRRVLESLFDFKTMAMMMRSEPQNATCCCDRVNERSEKTNRIQPVEEEPGRYGSRF
jgi:hypothetical protein